MNGTIAVAKGPWGVTDGFRRASLFFLELAGLCLLVWVSSWMWALGLCIPLPIEGHAIEMGIDSGSAYVILFHDEGPIRPLIYRTEARWLAVAETDPPGYGQRTLPLLWLAAACALVGAVGGACARPKRIHAATRVSPGDALSRDFIAPPS